MQPAKDVLDSLQNESHTTHQNTPFLQTYPSRPMNDMSDSEVRSLPTSSAHVHEPATDNRNPESDLPTVEEARISDGFGTFPPIPSYQPPPINPFNPTDNRTSEGVSGLGDIRETSKASSAAYVSDVYSTLPTSTMPLGISVPHEDPRVDLSSTVPPAPLSSGFPYPFSIMGPGVTNDLEHRTNCPIISWGFGGTLVVSIPPSFDDHTNANENTNQGAGNHYRVKLYELNSMSPELHNDDLAASYEAIPPFRIPLSTHELRQLANMCDRLSVAPTTLPRPAAEGRGAIWRLLAHMCRQNDDGWRNSAASALGGPSSVRTFGRKGSGILSVSAEQSPFLGDLGAVSETNSDQHEAGLEVERLVGEGNSIGALRIARDSGLWGIAFVLASALDRSKQNEVITDFARATLKDSSTLHTLCLAVSENYSEMEAKATSISSLNQWRKTVGMLLTSWKTSLESGNGNASKLLKIIDKVGQGMLSSKHDPVAAHLCFLVSGSLSVLSSEGFVLLGADHSVPAGRPRSFGSSSAVLQSLVFEAICCARGGNVFYHLLPFRYLLAAEVCSAGRPDVALAHCEWIVSTVKGVFQSGHNEIASTFTLPFLASLEALDLRLRKHLGTSDQKSKPGTLTTLRNSLSSVFNRKPVSRGVEKESDQDGSGHTRSHISDATMSKSSPELHAPQYKKLHTQADHLGPRPNASKPPILPIPPPASLPQGHQPPRSQVQQPMGMFNQNPSEVKGVRQQSSVNSGLNHDNSGKVEPKASEDGWSSLMLKTVGLLAPAGGDLSPPPRTRSDDHIPGMAQTLLGGRTDGHSSFVNRSPRSALMRASSSTGDMVTSGEMYCQTGSNGAMPTQHVERRDHSMRNTRHDGERWNPAIGQGDIRANREFGEDSTSTAASKASVKKPPLPPKSSSGAEVGSDESIAPRGWRARIAERLKSTFGSAKRAHMGEKNKFVYDDKLGRWVIPGEDVSEDNALPPPPPDDNELAGQGATVLSSSVSYDDVLENSHGRGQSDRTDMHRSHSFQQETGYDGQVSAPVLGLDSINQSAFVHDASITTDGVGFDRAYPNEPESFANSYAGMHTSNTGTNQMNEDDATSYTVDTMGTGRPLTQHRHQAFVPQALPVMHQRVPTQASGTMAPSRPIGPGSPAAPPPNPNKYRAGMGRLSGKRAYVDTFNKGSKPRAHGVMPPVPGANRLVVPTPAPSLGLTRHVGDGLDGGGYHIFTPNPQSNPKPEGSHESGLHHDNPAQSSGGEVLNQNTMSDTSELQDNPAQSSVDANFYSAPAPMQQVAHNGRINWWSNGRDVSNSEPATYMNQRPNTHNATAPKSSGPKYPRMMA